LDIFYRQILTIREFTFARNASLIEIQQALFEFVVMITVCDINGTDSAIKAARRNQFGSYLHMHISPDVPSSNAANA
jgi:hypothetical protein